MPPLPLFNFFLNLICGSLQVEIFFILTYIRFENDRKPETFKSDIHIIESEVNDLT